MLPVQSWVLQEQRAGVRVCSVQGRHQLRPGQIKLHWPRQLAVCVMPPGQVGQSLRSGALLLYKVVLLSCKATCEYVVYRDSVELADENTCVATGKRCATSNSLWVVNCLVGGKCLKITENKHMIKIHQKYICQSPPSPHRTHIFDLSALLLSSKLQ